MSMKVGVGERPGLTIDAAIILSEWWVDGRKEVGREGRKERTSHVSFGRNAGFGSRESLHSRLEVPAGLAQTLEAELGIEARLRVQIVHHGALGVGLWAETMSIPRSEHRSSQALSDQLDV